FAAMDSVRIKAPIDIDSRWFDKAVARDQRAARDRPRYRLRRLPRDARRQGGRHAGRRHARPSWAVRLASPSMSRSPTRTTVATHANPEGWRGTHPFSDSTARETGPPLRALSR